MDEALGGETFDPQECKGAGEGRQARKGRCRGLLEFEADDVSGKQVRWGLLHPTQWHFGTEGGRVAMFCHQNFRSAIGTPPCNTFLN